MAAHGSIIDRARADAYYGRSRNPHRFRGNSYTSERIIDLTEDEIAVYNAAYTEMELSGDRKDWGNHGN